MAPSSGRISNLLSEVASFAYPDIQQQIEDQCMPIAGHIAYGDQHEQADAITTMLEFHHDGSKTIDVSFFGKNWSDISQKNMMPPWWAKIEDICVDGPKLAEQGEPPFFDRQTCQQKHPRPSDAARTGFQLGSNQIIECEIRDKQLCTAGIFIAPVRNSDDRTKPCFDTTFEAIKAITAANEHCIIGDDTKSKTMVECIENALGIPAYIGVMVGRMHGFKLVFKRLTNSSEMRRILESESFEFRTKQFADQAISAFADLASMGDIKARPCLDLDFETNTISPRVCVEILPTHPFTETKNWHILTRLAEIFQLQPEEVAHARQTHRHLPIGKKPDPAISMLLKLFHNQPQDLRSRSTHAKVAALSHYKICLEPGKSIALKSYVYVIEKALSGMGLVG